MTDYDLKRNVMVWLDLDDKLKAIRKSMKELTKEKKEYEKKILVQLEKVKDNTIEVGDGKLSRNITKSKAPLKKEIIFDALVKLTKNDNKAKEMTTYILDSRPEIEKIKLKRSRNKKKK
jgi:hypothetical protein